MLSNRLITLSTATLAGALVALTPAAGAATLTVLPLSGGNFQDPAGTLVVDNLIDGGPAARDGERDVDRNRDNLQSFTIPTATQIDSIAFNIVNFQSGGSATPLRFEFFAIADASVTDPAPVGPIIDTFTFVAADLGLTNGSSATLVFDVLDTAAAAGSAFAARFEEPNGTGNTTHFIQLARNFGYDGGRASETGTDPAANEDYAFGVVQVVPEPASLALVGLGGLCLLGRRRA